MLSSPPADETPNQMTPEYVLNPLAIYRMARHDMKHNDKAVSDIGTLGSSAQARSPEDNDATSPMEGSSGLTEMQSPVDVAAVPAVTGAVDWSLSELFPLPTSFDDLQTYMQLPLMVGNGGTTYDGSMAGPEIGYGSMSFGGEIAPNAPLGFGLVDISDGAAGYPSSLQPNLRWPRREG